MFNSLTLCPFAIKRLDKNLSEVRNAKTITVTDNSCRIFRLAGRTSPAIPGQSPARTDCLHSQISIARHTPRRRRGGHSLARSRNDRVDDADLVARLLSGRRLREPHPE